MDKGPKSIKDFKTLTGQVNVLARKKAKDFAAGIDHYYKNYSGINEQ